MKDEEKIVNVKQMLEETIIRENELLSGLDIGSPERKQAMDAFERLYKLRLEETKAGDEFYNNEEKRKAEMKNQEERLKLEEAMHNDKMHMEERKLNQDKEISDEDVKLRKIQMKDENKRNYLELGKAAAGVTLWAAMSFALIRLEATGSMRSKAFTGTIPKFKFW